MLAGEGLDGGSGVHVGDWNDLGRVENAAELPPAGFHLPNVGHIRHRTTGAAIRKNHNLAIAAEDIGAFGHEVNAAKYDELALGFGSLLRELEGIAAEVGELHHLVALVVVAENHGILAEFGLGRRDAIVERTIGHQEVEVEDATDALFNFGRADGLGLWRPRQRVFGDEGKPSHRSIPARSATFQTGWVR